MKINIEPYRKQKNISLYQLAKNIDVTYPTIFRIYKGESTSIKLEILEALCLELECTPNDILIFEHSTDTVEDSDKNAG